MAVIHWKSASSGAFSVGSDWIGGVAPGASDDAALSAAGASFTVTAGYGQQVHSMTTAANVTLAIVTGTFTATDGTGTGANAGAITLADGVRLAVGGAIANAGVIALNGSASFTDLEVVSNTTLTGAGQLQLGDSEFNRIFGAAASDILFNDSTIVGAGQLGMGQLSLDNQSAGVIDAMGGQALVLDTSGEILTNTGLVEATGSAGLVIEGSTTIANGGGTIDAATGSVVELNGAAIAGGTLTSSGSGFIAVVNSGDILDGVGAAVTNAAAIVVEDNSRLQIEGSVANSRTIGLMGGVDFTDLELIGNTTLTGVGQIELSDSSTNRIFAAAAGDTLVNDSTIAGAGQVGIGQLTLDNRSGGVIDAVGSNALVLDTSGHTAVNAGLIEGAGTAGLEIQATTIANTGGTIRAANGSVVTLNGGAIIGGTTTTSGSGVIEIVGAGNLLEGAAAGLTNVGVIDIGDASQLSVGGLIANSGTIALLGVGDNTDLLVSANTNLTGSGRVMMSDASTNRIYGLAASVVLSNAGVIAGAGQVGAGQLTLINRSGGVIDATGAGNALVLDMGAGKLTNDGLIEASGTGGLVIDGGVVNESGGTIYAGANTTVSLDQVTLRGGVGAAALGSAATGVIDLNGGSVDIQGSSANAGAIDLVGGGAIAELRVLAAGATLGGGGAVNLQGTRSRLIGVSAGATLTNSGDTISGVGSIGLKLLTLVNLAGGVIDASAKGALNVNTFGEVLTNAGLMEATGGGRLAIAATTVNNTGGAISAAAGSSVDLEGDDIEGGMVASVGSGLVNITSANDTFDGVARALTIAGAIRVLNAATLTLQGAIINTGKIETLAGASATSLCVGAAGLTLSGAGDVILNDSANNRIFGLATGDKLTNVNNLIEGAGDVGGGVMTLVNDAAGVIRGDQGISLTIDTGANLIVNAGTIENTGAGGTFVESAVNNNGVLEVTKGTLTLDLAVVGTGRVLISGGKADFLSTFAESVTFAAAGGTLELARSRSYTGKITGFAKTSVTTLDLGDIAFGAKTKATFSGTTTSGVLTVTDGTHTSKINLVGNYTASTFTVATDGHGGTTVTDPPAAAFASAMAAFGPGSGTVATIAPPQIAPPLVLAHG